MPAQVVEDLLERAHLDRPLRTSSHQVIGQQRQTLDVVKVRVRQQHVTDFALLGLAQPCADGPRIHHAGLVDEKPARAALEEASVAIIDG